MFSKFLDFVKEEKHYDFDSSEQFLKSMGGRSFLNGMYRIFDEKSIPKWNDIVKKSFPKYKNQISVFGYDWLGRIFALNKASNTVLLFEPGTGDVFDIPANIVDFHNVEIVEFHEDSLLSEYFDEWFEANNNFVLPINKCVGYKVPLFLNGEDDIENLEVSDMEVYWEIMMPLMNL